MYYNRLVRKEVTKMDNLSNEKMRMSLVIPRKIRKKLEIVADKEGLSSSALIVKLITNYIKRNYRDIFDAEVEVKPVKKKSKDEWSW